VRTQKKKNTSKGVKRVSRVLEEGKGGKTTLIGVGKKNLHLSKKGKGRVGGGKQVARA